VTPADLKLVLVALIAIGALVVLVTKFKVNAFISLLLASLIVGLSAVGMGAKSRGYPEQAPVSADKLPSVNGPLCPTSCVSSTPDGPGLPVRTTSAPSTLLARA
jgi:hypothetical protein